MMRFARRALGAGCLFLQAAALGVCAEKISLPDCVMRARTHSLKVLQGEIAQRQAKAVLDGSKSRRLPQLSGLGALEKSDDPSRQLEGSNQAVLHVEQTVYPFSADWVRAREQSAALEAAQLARLEINQDAELNVKQLYFSILNADEALRNLDRVQKELERLRETIIPRFSVGRVPHFDLIKVRVALSDLARSADLIRVDQASKKSELAQLIGEPADAAIELRSLPGVPELPDSAKLQEQMPENPTLGVLSRQAYADELGAKAAKRERLPGMVTAFEYGNSGPTTRSMPLGWSFTAGLRLPLYDWGSISARVEQEQSQAALSRNRLGLQKQSLQTEFVGTSADARARLADYRRLGELLPEARKAAAASIDQYRRGAMGILEATDSLNLWLQTLLNERGAYYAYLSDLARLERLSGGKTVIHYGL